MADEQGGIGGFRWLADTITGARALLAGAAGRTFGGNRDLYSVLGYARKITPEQYQDRYRRNSIAARIVEALPEATWRGGGEVLDNEDPENVTEFEKQWADFARRIKLWNVLLRADIVAGLGRYSVVLLGAPGRADEPLPTPLKLDEIQFLSVFSEAQCRLQETDLERDISNPRYGQPNFYTLTSSNLIVSPKSSVTWRRVHYSRVLHICDSALDSPMFGTPRLERVWNLLDDLEKITGGGAEAFWLRANQGLHINVDPEVKYSVDQQEALQEQVDKYAHGITRVLRTRGVGVDVLGSDTASIQPNVDSIMTLLAGGTKIPKRILTGSEQGEMASTQDRSNWAERVSDRRRNFADPMVVRPLIDRLIEHQALPPPDKDPEDLNGGYEIRWPNIQNLDEKERADVALKMANINRMMGQTVVVVNELRDKFLLMPPLTKKALRSNAKLKEAEGPATTPETKLPNPNDRKDTAAPEKKLEQTPTELSAHEDEDDLIDEDTIGRVSDLPLDLDED